MLHSPLDVMSPPELFNPLSVPPYGAEMDLEQTHCLIQKMILGLWRRERDLLKQETKHFADGSGAVHEHTTGA